MIRALDIFRNSGRRQEILAENRASPWKTFLGRGLHESRKRAYVRDGVTSSRRKTQSVLKKFLLDPRLPHAKHPVKDSLSLIRVETPWTLHCQKKGLIISSLRVMASNLVRTNSFDWCREFIIAAIGLIQGPRKRALEGVGWITPGY